MRNTEWESITVNRKTLDTTLVAMIDIMCVLLLFFITATSFRQSGVPITPPTSSQRTSPTHAVIELAITATGQVYVDNKPVPLSQIATLVATRVAGRPDQSAIIHPDKDVKTQALLAVLDACKNGGASQFQIVAIQGRK